MWHWTVDEWCTRAIWRTFVDRPRPSFVAFVRGTNTSAFGVAQLYLPHSPTNPAVNEQGLLKRERLCVCLTRWSFFGFLYVLEWLAAGTAEPQRAGRRTVLQLSHGSLNFTALSRKYSGFTSFTRSRNVSRGSALAGSKYDNNLSTFEWKSNAARFCPLAVKLGISNLKIRV